MKLLRKEVRGTTPHAIQSPLQRDSHPNLHIQQGSESDFTSLAKEVETWHFPDETPMDALHL